MKNASREKAIADTIEILRIAEATKDLRPLNALLNYWLDINGAQVTISIQSLLESFSASSLEIKKYYLSSFKLSKEELNRIFGVSNACKIVKK